MVFDIGRQFDCRASNGLLDNPKLHASGGDKNTTGLDLVSIDGFSDIEGAEVIQSFGEIMNMV